MLRPWRKGSKSRLSTDHRRAGRIGRKMIALAFERAEKPKIAPSDFRDAHASTSKLDEGNNMA
jgi:hypothetical protein